MGHREIHQCECAKCTAGDEVFQQEHQQLNLLMSRLDEQERRWLAGMEANKLGHGGTRRLNEITGLDINTIRKGRRELETKLASRPKDRVRAVGGGRKRAEKKT